jgi:hypothetical protein
MCCRGSGPGPNPDLILPKFPWQLIHNHQKRTLRSGLSLFASDAFRKRDRFEEFAGWAPGYRCTHYELFPCDRELQF